MNQQCKVCGEPAAGFHFGAFTCEGCKSFFGRTHNNLSSISECKNNGECVIDKKNRTSCKACRLRKCLSVGMSKSGSRYGRRSNWFKINWILQEQQQQQQQHQQHQHHSGVFGTTPPPGLYPSALFAAHPPLSSWSAASFPTHNKRRKLDERSSSPEDSDDSSSRLSASVGLSTPTPPFLHNTPPPPPRFLYPNLVTRPGLAPANPRMLLFVPPQTCGGDLMLCSPAVAGVAVEQDQPIDLSVKAGGGGVPTNNHVDDDDDERLFKDSSPSLQSVHDSPERLTCKERPVTTPLDLTNKRGAEVPLSG